MTPRTILYISPSSRLLGARRSLLQLVTNLDPDRYRPIVATKPEGDLVTALRDAGFPVRPLFMGEWRKAKYFLSRRSRIRELAAIARDSQVALIHANEFHSNPYAIRAARKAGNLPVITHMRLSITPRRIEKYELARARRIVCVSRAASEDFAVWPDREQRVEVVYNGVDLDQFRRRHTREQSRLSLRLGADCFVAAQFGLISPRKRPHLLLKAATLLRQSLGSPHDFCILLVGSPGKSDLDYEKDLKEAVAKEGLRDIVRFVPFTPDVVCLYEACDVNVLVSNDEGFGRTIIEAAALGMPSVGANVGGIPELIENGKTGFLIDADDDGTSLADRLQSLAGDPARRIE
ncbi:glycosyltransferase family 4 protein, partial [bacterium]|nr:glycosyltransferase family 4 protein [bacterium]